MQVSRQLPGCLAAMRASKLMTGTGTERAQRSPFSRADARALSSSSNEGIGAPFLHAFAKASPGAPPAAVHVRQDGACYVIDQVRCGKCAGARAQTRHTEEVRKSSRCEFDGDSERVLVCAYVAQMHRRDEGGTLPLRLSGTLGPWWTGQNSSNFGVTAPQDGNRLLDGLAGLWCAPPLNSITIATLHCPFWGWASCPEQHTPWV